MKVLIRIGMGGRVILMAMVMGRVHTGVSLVNSSYSATIWTQETKLKSQWTRMASRTNSWIYRMWWTSQWCQNWTLQCLN